MRRSCMSSHTTHSSKNDGDADDAENDDSAADDEYDDFDDDDDNENMFFFLSLDCVPQRSALAASLHVLQSRQPRCYNRSRSGGNTPS